ncbi:MAG: C39 family peptidase [Aeromicrobium sp.]|uniref:C39 family peptidase n=1 Tax=Aeromicrobium sp. TaxID=1871063 RepID=UPI0026284BF2|nr:C39 family peptidase [Aeromicrobium sp.]MDF1704171.1 C39 family peptidase [Aeromicrobium sp.]
MSDPSDDLIGNQQFDDLDGDGVVDTVVEYFDDNSSIATYDTDGDGKVDAADIDSDGDGKVDLAVIDLGNGQVGVYEDPGDTSAQPTVVDLEQATELAPDLVDSFGDELGESEFQQTGFGDDDDDDEKKGSDGPTSWFADGETQDDDDTKNIDFDDDDDDDQDDDGKHPQGDPDSTSLVGDPFGDAELWFEQAVNGTCAPSAIAQIVSEYTGQTFTNEEEFATWAVENGVMEVLPDGTTTGMYAPDIVDMLEAYDVPAELEDGLEIQDLKEMLADDVGVAVMVDADEYWGPMYGYDPGPENNAINHIVMLTGIDEDKGVVYVNDTGTPDGEAMEIPIEYFEDAWEDGNNQAVVCDEPAPDTAASTVGSGLPQSDSVSSLLEGKWAMLPVVLRGDEVAAARA